MHYSLTLKLDLIESDVKYVHLYILNGQNLCIVFLIIFNYMITLTNATEIMLSFLKIIKFNHIVYWPMQSHV